jgi:hypothetical protein
MDHIDAEHELLATFALLTDDHREQVLFIARELLAWQDRYPQG